MSSEDSASKDSAVIDDDLVEALGFEPTSTRDDIVVIDDDDEAVLEAADLDDDVTEIQADSDDDTLATPGLDTGVVGLVRLDNSDDDESEDAELEPLADGIDLSFDDDVDDYAPTVELDEDSAELELELEQDEVIDLVDDTDTDTDSDSDTESADAELEDATADDIETDDVETVTETDDIETDDVEIDDAELEVELEPESDDSAPSYFDDLELIDVDADDPDLDSTDLDSTDLDSTDLDSTDLDGTDLDEIEADDLADEALIFDVEADEDFALEPTGLVDLDDLDDLDLADGAQPPPPLFDDAISDADISSDNIDLTQVDLTDGESTTDDGALSASEAAAVVATGSNVPVRNAHKNKQIRARKARRVIRHVDPWSVLTFSILFHLCFFAAMLLSSVLVWNAAQGAGIIDNAEGFIIALGDYETFEINGDAMFRAAMLISGILTLASTVLVVLLTVVFNLISDLVGGIRITVIEEETVRIPAGAKK